MDIKNCKEIITEFVERYNFANIYTDNSLPIGNNQSSLFFKNSEAISFLLASSITGSKNIGFFRLLPNVNVTHPLRGECIFISRQLPDKIDIPTIFCRKPEELSKILVLAIKASSESKLPISVVMSDNAVNNYTISEKITCDLVRASAYLHKNTYQTKMTQSNLEDCYNTVENIFNQNLDNNISDTLISFNDSKSSFFSYLMPNKAPDKILSSKSKYSSYEDEVYQIEKLLNNTYSLNISIDSTEKDEHLPEFKDFLCPGCPIVNIIAKLKNDETIIFTDIDCKGVEKAFNINIASFETYLGIISDNLSVKTIFIGSASNYKQYHNKMLKNGQVIFLNDCNINNIPICTTIKNPKKLTTNKNQLFPYSCSNIKNYNKVKINLKKCNCLEENKEPICIDKVKCPAFYVKDNKVYIDNNTCTGCVACKIVCPNGAIK